MGAGRAPGGMVMTALLRRALAVCATLGLLFLMTGCGALSAMANPKVAWAISDPAPMSVVVRRADAAEGTSKQVDRLLTATPASPESDWLKNVGPKPEVAAQDMKALTEDPMYKVSRARVVPAEVWMRTLGDLQSTDGSSPNVLAMVSQDLGDQYAAITAKEQEIAQLDARIEAEKQARDAKGASDGDKKAHDTAIDDLKSQKSKKEDEVDPLKKKFLDACKDAAAQTPADRREALAPALVNLRQAVDDASIADGAAAVRYPLALKSIVDSVKEVVPVFVADIIEEQTGHRPVMTGFKPDVSLDGTDVKLTINGLSKDDLGKMDVGDLTTQTIGRTKDWVVHAIGLYGAIAASKDRLSFEQDTLDALLDGFAKNGWKRSTAVAIPLATDPKVMSATAKVRPHVRPTASAPAVGVAETQPAKPGASPVAAAKAPGKTPGARNAPKAQPSSSSPSSLPPAPMRLEDFK